MRIVLGGWVIPVSSPPIRDGAIAIDGDEIAAVGPGPEILRKFGDQARLSVTPPGRAHSDLAPAPAHTDLVPASTHPDIAPATAHPDLATALAGSNPVPAVGGIIDFRDAVLLPSFVNAHTHLELSWMRRDPTPRGDFMAWVRAMIGRRAASPEEVDSEARLAIAEMEAAGTALLGDVGNTTASLAPLARSGLRGRFFFELIGRRKGRPALTIEESERRLEEALGAWGPPSDGTRTASIVPHGPHTVSSALLAQISDRARCRGDIVSLHLAESAEEDELLRRGTGPFRALGDEVGAFGADWTPPHLSPAKVLDHAGLLGPRTLAVHGVHLSRDDIRLLARRGTTVVLCPRSNAWLGVGEAPVASLLAEGVRLAIGTDSYASNESLDVLAELAALRRLVPGVPGETLLRAATLGGAEALGLASHFGSLEPGKRASLVTLTMQPANGTTISQEPGEPYATIFLRPLS